MGCVSLWGNLHVGKCEEFCSGYRSQGPEDTTTTPSRPHPTLLPRSHSFSMAATIFHRDQGRAIRLSQSQLLVSAEQTSVRWESDMGWRRPQQSQPWLLTAVLLMKVQVVDKIVFYCLSMSLFYSLSRSKLLYSTSRDKTSLAFLQYRVTHMVQVRSPVWELRRLFGLNYFSLQISSGFAAFPFVPFSFAWFLYAASDILFRVAVRSNNLGWWIMDWKKGCTILESLFSAFCRDKGFPEWVFQLSVLKNREKEEKKEKASQEGWEGSKGRKETKEWANKRNTISSVWSMRNHSTLWVFSTCFPG